MRQWRLIYDMPTTGALNMAADEAILTAVSEGYSSPTLRLYAWEPACLSLGYGQKMRDVDPARLATRGWDLVRRPTGGRAILHIDELTYSVALPADDSLASGGVLASYQRLSRALLAAVETLGARVASDRREEHARAFGPVCFEVPSHYEITADGRKLVGSAQLRRKNGVLQHGSLPLFGDVARICDALFYPDEAARQAAKASVRERAATLADALGGAVVSWPTAAAAVADAFASVLDTDFTVGALSDREGERAQALAEDVYGSAAHIGAR